MFSCEYCEVFKKILFKEHHRCLRLYFKFIGKLMTYIFNIILCVSIFISSSFSLSVLLKLLKHVKLILFENYHEFKTKHLFLIKKVVTRTDKKWRHGRKRALMKRSGHCSRRLYLSGLEEDPITENP